MDLLKTSLQLAASLGTCQRTPTGRSHRQRGRKRDIALQPTDDFESVTGNGVTGKVDGRTVALGNIKLLARLDIDPGIWPAGRGRRAAGQTVMFVAIDGQGSRHASVWQIPIKDSRRDAIRDLHAEGVQVVMLTGDNHTTAHGSCRTG